MNQPIVRKLVDEIDRQQQQPRPTPVPANEIRPPSYGGPQRDAINSVVDNIIGDLCGKIGELRKSLDILEQQVLEGAATAKTALQDHVGVCVKVNDEIVHMREVVEEIRASVSQPPK